MTSSAIEMLRRRVASRAPETARRAMKQSKRFDLGAVERAQGIIQRFLHELAWSGMITPPIEIVAGNWQAEVLIVASRTAFMKRSAAMRMAPGAAVDQEDAELVRRIAAEDIAAAQLVLNAAADAAITSSPTSKPKVSLMTARLLTADHEERARLTVALGAGEHGAQGFRQADAIELARKFIEIIAQEQPLLLEILLVHDANYSARMSGVAVRSRPPPPLVLQANFLTTAWATGPQTILDAIGDASHRVGADAARKGFEPSIQMLRRDQRVISGPCRDLAQIGDAQDFRSVAFPLEAASLDVPDVRRFLDRRQDADKVEAFCLRQRIARIRIRRLRPIFSGGGG